jgi:hypothetical protein
MSAAAITTPLSQAGTSDARISFFERAKQKAPSGEITIYDFAKQIREGIHAEAVARVRAKVEECAVIGSSTEETKAALHPLKLALPCVTLSGVITEDGRRRAFEEGRFLHSGWLQIDLDKADLQGRSLEEVREKLKNDPHLLFVAVSPSGEGLKGLCRIPVCETPEQHLAAFEAAEAYFLETYALRIDPQTKDPARCCYATHDPSITWRINPSELPVPQPQLVPVVQIGEHRQEARTASVDDDDSLLATPESVRHILHCIPNKRPRKEWLKVCAAVADAVGKDEAIPMLEEWCPPYRPGEYQSAFEAPLQRITKGSLVAIAKNHGFDSKAYWRELYAGREWTGKLTFAGKAPGAGGDLNDLAEKLASRAFDFDVQPEKPLPILSLNSKPLITPGGIMNIQGPPKSAKSAVVRSSIAAIFNDNRIGPDTLGLSASNHEGHMVLHIDTEQSRYDHDNLVRQACRQAHVDRPPEWFASYTLVDLDIAERRAALRLMMEMGMKARGGVFAVVIDGIADLCLDPNDSAEAFGLVKELVSLATTYKAGIITVLHENPGGDGKTRGHLGSELERKAEANVRLAKDAAGVTTMWSEKGRHLHLPKLAGHCFAWNDEAGMHTSCGTAGQIKSEQQRSKMLDDAEKVFGDAASLRHTDLKQEVCRRLDIKDRAAKDRISKWYAEGIIIKNKEDEYKLVNP